MQPTEPAMRKTPLAALALLALALAMALCAAPSAHAAQLEAGTIAPSAPRADAELAGQAASSKSAPPAIQYRVKAAKASWSGAKAGGKTASIGKSALSQFKLKLAGAEPPGAVKYRAYVSGKGWRPWKAGNKPAGAKIARGVLKLLVDGIKRRLDHSEGKGQLDHCVGHYDQQPHVLRIEVCVSFDQRVPGKAQRQPGV